MRAVSPRATATSLSALSSGSDSTLKAKMPASSANSISARVLPTPENTIFSGGTLTASARLQLAFRHHVHAGAVPSQRGEHAEIGVGLDRIADERAGHVGERVGEDAVVALERRRRIAIEGGPDRGGEIGKIDLLGVEHVFVGHAAPVGEMMHRRRGVYSSSLSIQRRRAGALDILVDGSALVSAIARLRPFQSEPRRPQAESPIVSTSTSVKRMRNALPMVVPLSLKPFRGL